jgi:hypothetical protein
MDTTSAVRVSAKREASRQTENPATRTIVVIIESETTRTILAQMVRVRNMRLSIGRLENTEGIEDRLKLRLTPASQSLGRLPKFYASIISLR